MSKNDQAIIDQLPRGLKALAEVIGLDMTLKVAKELGGTEFFIPKGEALYNHLRNLRIKADYDSGDYTVVQLARKYGLTDRMIFHILKTPDTLGGETPSLPFSD